jgi:hypothetical protein
MITRVSSVIRPEGSDLVFDHPYNAEYARDAGDTEVDGRRRYGRGLRLARGSAAVTNAWRHGRIGGCADRRGHWGSRAAR